MTTRKDAIVAVSAKQFSDQFGSYFADAEKEAMHAFADNDEQGEPKARIAFVATWNPASSTPKVESVFSWPARRRFATEDVVDPNQIKLPLGGDV